MTFILPATAEEKVIFVNGLLEGLRRHTWMKDGVTYVGNGTYTLSDAIDMLVKDYPEYQNLITFNAR